MATLAAQNAPSGRRVIRRPKHALEGRGFCHIHVSPSRQVRPTNYDAGPCGSRFLEVDPVEGGSCNDYEYVCGDPINAFDLDGTRSCKWNHPSDCGKAAKKFVKKNKGALLAVASTAACFGGPLACGLGFAAAEAIGRGGAINRAIRTGNGSARVREAAGVGVDFAFYRLRGKAVRAPIRYPRGSIRWGFVEVGRQVRQSLAGAGQPLGISSAARRGLTMAAEVQPTPYGRCRIRPWIRRLQFSLNYLPVLAFGLFAWSAAPRHWTLQGPTLKSIRLRRAAHDISLPTLALDAQVDPVEGRSANDDDYVSGDPVNSFDLWRTGIQPPHAARSRTDGRGIERDGRFALVALILPRDVVEPASNTGRNRWVLAAQAGGALGCPNLMTS